MGNITTPVILSGGSGSRLWPVSVPARPKQLHRLIGEDTLLQATVKRVLDRDDATPPVVVCNRSQLGDVVEQLGEFTTPGMVVLEPEGRNTAPGVAAAAMLLEPDVIMAVLPADHVIADELAFQGALSEAVEAAAAGAIVTFGVVPTRPETGFGYIEASDLTGGAVPVRRFVEKPDAAAAEGYVAAGYLWNSGMFVVSAGTILEELRRFEPALVDAVAASIPMTHDESIVRLDDTFLSVPAISLDNAVMEKTDRAAVVPLDAGWSDVGSWHAVWEMVVAGDDDDTVRIGDVETVDVHRSYIRAESRPVAVIGLDDVVVIETPDAVLVVDRNRSQDVRLAADWFFRLRRDAE